MAFKQGNQLGKKSSRKGIPNRATVLPKKLTEEAIEQLSKSVQSGELKAILWVLERSYPSLKAITVPNSLDGEMLEGRINELTELAQKVEELEALLK